VQIAVNQQLVAFADTSLAERGNSRTPSNTAPGDDQASKRVAVAQGRPKPTLVLAESDYFSGAGTRRGPIVIDAIPPANRSSVVQYLRIEGRYRDAGTGIYLDVFA
jgi:hypothetical protein